jgi:hypothetical protein
MRTILALLAAFWIAMVFAAKWQIERLRAELLDVEGLSRFGRSSCCGRRVNIVCRGCGFPAKPTQIELGLRWLARHQEQDGRWSGAHFDDHCSKIRCKGAGYFEDDETLTALALLDLLGYGVTPQNRASYTDPLDRRSRRLGETIRDGLRWLIAQQAEDGAIGPRDQLLVAHHTLAALVLVEAYGMTNAVAYRAPAQKAVNFLEASRARDLGFGFAPGDRTSDRLVTRRALLVLRVARDAGLEVALDGFVFEHLHPCGQLDWSALEGEAPIASYQETALRGCAEGSFDGPRGRVDATVRKILAIELYYRYVEPARLRE